MRICLQGINIKAICNQKEEMEKQHGG